MKTLILSIVVITQAHFTSAQNVTIPDENFKNALIEGGIDTDKDGDISYTEAEAITSLDVAGRDISDMTGIEAFINLDRLSCFNNQLLNIDISQNTALRTLWCGGCGLSSLDISTNFALETLYCGSAIDDVNYLTNLDVSNNIALKYLDCGWNQLSVLDVSDNAALEHLFIQNMPSLHEVCVWDDFSTDSFNVSTVGSPNVLFTTECSVTALNTSEVNSTISFYPNPATDRLIIEFAGIINQQTSIVLFDITGKVLYSKILDSTAPLTLTINLSSFGKGLYLIRISNERYSVTEKVIIE